MATKRTLDTKDTEEQTNSEPKTKKGENFFRQLNRVIEKRKLR